VDWSSSSETWTRSLETGQFSRPGVPSHRRCPVSSNLARVSVKLVRGNDAALPRHQAWQRQHKDVARALQVVRIGSGKEVAHAQAECSAAAAPRLPGGYRVVDGDSAHRSRGGRVVRGTARAKGQVRPVHTGAPLPPIVVGTSGQMIDFMPGDPPLGPSCPPEADYVVRSPFRSGGTLLCLDTKPGDTNTRG
jgi:hypothetical protein